MNNKEKEFLEKKEKVLVTCISFRYRHLMLNLVDLTVRKITRLNLNKCRKSKDLYLWMSKCPNGPSVKFLVNAVHTMEELKLTGNHLKGSRPILTFSDNFDHKPHWTLLKQMITQIFLASQRTTGNPSLTMIMFLFSQLSMTTYGSKITRYLVLITEHRNWTVGTWKS